MSRRTGLIILAAVALLLVALGAGVALGRSDFSPKPREYTSAVTSIDVRVGERFTISLDGNRTTGYQWQLAQPLEPSILVLTNSVYEPDAPGRIGAGGREVLTFQAVGRGTTVIHLEFVRPWEKNIPATKTSAFTVVVQ